MAQRLYVSSSSSRPPLPSAIDVLNSEQILFWLRQRHFARYLHTNMADLLFSIQHSITARVYAIFSYFIFFSSSLLFLRILQTVFFLGFPKRFLLCRRKNIDLAIDPEIPNYRYFHSMFARGGWRRISMKKKQTVSRTNMRRSGAELILFYQIKY